MSDEEIDKLAGAEVSSEVDVPKNVSPGGRSRGPLPGTHGRPKGYPVSGAAKEVKESARARREQEQREREAKEHPTSGHDAAIALMAPLPPDWRE
jgi:hypothetical protein